MSHGEIVPGDVIADYFSTKATAELQSLPGATGGTDLPQETEQPWALRPMT